MIPNGKERKGEWEDGVRVRWLDERENINSYLIENNSIRSINS